MNWRPKVREATLEEALDAARLEFENYWHRTMPQFLILPDQEGHPSLYPIQQDFEKQPTLLCLIDLTTLEGLGMVRMFNAWRSRYKFFPVQYVVILTATYPCFLDREWMKSMLESLDLDCSVAIDFDGKFAFYFDAFALPKTILLWEGRFLVHLNGHQALIQTESLLQEFLRKADPGLPLEPAFHPREFQVFAQTQRTELGHSPKIGKPKPWKGLDQHIHLQKSDILPDATHAKWHFKEPTEKDALLFTGKWEQNDGSIMTKDPQARVTLKPDPLCLFFAEGLTTTLEKSKMIVTIQDKPVRDAFRGKDLTPDDAGRSAVVLGKPRLYEVTKDLPKGTTLTLSFPTADKAPIRLYGYRQGKVIDTRALLVLD
jgi:hypothetical protein